MNDDEDGKEVDGVDCGEARAGLYADPVQDSCAKKILNIEHAMHSRSSH